MHASIFSKLLPVLFILKRDLFILEEIKKTLRKKSTNYKLVLKRIKLFASDLDNPPTGWIVLRLKIGNIKHLMSNFSKCK